MKPDYKLSDKIQAVLDREGMTPAEFAAEAGTTPGTINDYTSKKKVGKWRDKVVVRVAGVVNKYEAKWRAADRRREARDHCSIHGIKPFYLPLPFKIMHPEQNEECYGSENAEMGQFFKFMEKRLRTKRHINALLAARIDNVQSLEERLDTINMLRGLADKSAKEIVDSFNAWRESTMTPEQKKQKAMQTWKLPEAIADGVAFDIGDECYVFESCGDRPVLAKGKIVGLTVDWFDQQITARYHEPRVTTRRFAVMYKIECPMASVKQYHADRCFRTKKEALMTIAVSE